MDNNPLAFTDPTGHSSIRQLLNDPRAFQFLATAAMGYMCGPNCAAATSYGFAKKNGATDRQAMMAAAVSYASVELGNPTSTTTTRIVSAAAIAAYGVYQANASGGNRGHAVASVAFSMAGTAAEAVLVVCHENKWSGDDMRHCSAKRAGRLQVGPGLAQLTGAQKLRCENAR